MSTSELVITELVFDNFFKDLEIEAIVAILSCMVSPLLYSNTLSTREVPHLLKRLTIKSCSIEACSYLLPCLQCNIYSTFTDFQP